MWYRRNISLRTNSKQSSLVRWCWTRIQFPIVFRISMDRHFCVPESCGKIYYSISSIWHAIMCFKNHISDWSDGYDYDERSSYKYVAAVASCEGVNPPPRLTWLSIRSVTIIMIPSLFNATLRRIKSVCSGGVEYDKYCRENKFRKWTFINGPLSDMTRNVIFNRYKSV